MGTAGISECDFRLLRYDICMLYKCDLTRVLHKRISHSFIGADKTTAYRIKLSTLFNDGNWRWQRLDKNKARAVRAQEEMKQKG
jgi:hypothetical protein